MYGCSPKGLILDFSFKKFLKGGWGGEYGGGTKKEASIGLRHSSLKGKEQPQLCFQVVKRSKCKVGAKTREFQGRADILLRFHSELRAGSGGNKSP